MEKMDIILCGLGGQGVLFMTKVLAETALSSGYAIMAAETHGMAQRGGSVISHLRLGKIKGSLVRSGSADLLLSLDVNEAYRNLGFLKSGGSLYVNAKQGRFPRDEVKGFLEKRGIRYFSFPATDEAMKLGSPLSSNLSLIGFFSLTAPHPFSPERIKETIKRISPERFQDINLKIFDISLNKAKDILKDKEVL